MFEWATLFIVRIHGCRGSNTMSHVQELLISNRGAAFRYKSPDLPTSGGGPAAHFSCSTEIDEIAAWEQREQSERGTKFSRLGRKLRVVGVERVLGA